MKKRKLTLLRMRIRYGKNAIDRDPELAKIIPTMPNVVYSTKPHQPTENQPEGALLYLRTVEGNDALAWMDKESKSVTESQFAILKAAECDPETPALLRHDSHHKLVAKGVQLIVETEKSVGGSLEGRRVLVFAPMNGSNHMLTKSRERCSMSPSCARP